jgi:hypothetical protein
MPRTNKSASYLDAVIGRNIRTHRTASGLTQDRMRLFKTFTRGRRALPGWLRPFCSLRSEPLAPRREH